MPLMRVHSIRNVRPRFPFLWGDKAATAMRRALELRYQLLTYHYSLAHHAFETGVPMMRPMVFSFNDTAVTDITSQWLDGEAILAAPVLREDASQQVVLPGDGIWYEWKSTVAHRAPTTLSLANVPLDHVPIYVRAGSIVPLSPPLQHVGQLPGGPLEVCVYAGADANFTMVEDDGDTDGYTRGRARRTTFHWEEESRTLRWVVHDDSFTFGHTFTELKLVVFSNDDSQTSSVWQIGAAGEISI